MVGSDKKGKVLLEATGTGGVKELCEKLSDTGIQYSWLRQNRTDDGGDSKRVKFVLIAWVGEVSSLRRARREASRLCSRSLRKPLERAAPSHPSTGRRCAGWLLCLCLRSAHCSERPPALHTALL